MALKATGDVTIKSAVGKSTIEAEENVLIAQGFIGGAIIKARDEINTQVSEFKTDNKIKVT
jgi:uncharacterized protein (DUF342 family)